MLGREQSLRVLMAMVAAFHLVVGVGINVSQGFVLMMAGAYGAQDIDKWSPQLFYALRPIGAFMIALGLIAAAAAWRPRSSRPVVYAFVVLFVLRALHRLLFNGEITELFGISSGRNLANMAFFFGLALALMIADFLAHRKTGDVTPA